MSTERQSLKKEAIRAKEAALKGNIIAAWNCLVSTILFILFSNYAFTNAVIWDEAHRDQSWATWSPFLMACFMVLLCGGLSAMAWCFVARDTKLLVQLRAIAAQEAAFQQPGVWPPPPRRPKGR